ncbi:extracellular solute-binding protein [bacterium]|nr:extracellular solute-binding protein [bacterium]
MKNIFIALAVCFVVFMLGCGGSGSPNTIAIWHQMLPEGGDILDSLAQVWGKENGYNVTVLYKETEELRSSFQTAVLGGGGPELVYGPSDQVGPFKVMDLIIPMDTLFSEQFFSKFDPKALVGFEGGLYQIADRIGNHLCLVYNRSLVPEPPKNTDEMVKIGKQITKDTDGDGKIDIYGLVWNFTEPYFFIPWLGGFGGWVMDDKGNPTLDTEGTVSALSFLVYLRDTAKIVPKELDYNIADALFKEGKAGMIINGPWSWGGYRKAEVDFAIARIPMVNKTGIWPTPMVSPVGYSINKNVDKSKLAGVISLLQFLTSAESQLEWTKVLGTIPSNIAARESEIVTGNPIVKASIKQLEVGKAMPVRPELRAIWDAMRPPYQGVLGGSITPKDAANEMQELAEKKIQEMNE